LGSFIPFAFIIRGESFFDSRYLYLPSLWVACIIAGILASFYIHLGKSKRGIKGICFACIIFVFSAFIFKQYQVVSRSIRSDVRIANIRRHIISQFETLFPSLPEKTVLYVDGTKRGYYGIEKNPLPFQHGFGYTVLIQNFRNGNSFTRTLLGNTTFYDVHEQGYYEKGAYGFGYFYEYNMLCDYVARGAVLPDHVIAVRYHDDTNQLENITLDILAELKRSEKGL
jgi:hypothetical protein